MTSVLRTEQRTAGVLVTSLATTETVTTMQDGPATLHAVGVDRAAGRVAGIAPLELVFIDADLLAKAEGDKSLASARTILLRPARLGDEHVDRSDLKKLQYGVVAGKGNQNWGTALNQDAHGFSPSCAVDDFFESQ